MKSYVICLSMLFLFVQNSNAGLMDYMSGNQKAEKLLATQMAKANDKKNLVSERKRAKAAKVAKLIAEQEAKVAEITRVEAEEKAKASEAAKLAAEEEVKATEAAKLAAEEKARKASEQVAAPEAQKSHGDAIPPPNNSATKAPEAPPATQKTSNEKMVYIYNKGPYTVEVSEVGGKAKDTILPKHIGRFRYEGFDSIVLGAKIIKGSGFFSGKVSEKKPVGYSNGSWAVIVEGEEIVSSSLDLSLLPRRN